VRDLHRVRPGLLPGAVPPAQRVGRRCGEVLQLLDERLATDSFSVADQLLLLGAYDIDALCKGDPYRQSGVVTQPIE
jgi:hypothetical protein